MTEVISVRFRNRGKTYFFAPNGHTVKVGEKVIVETSKGLEIAECRSGNHYVEDTAVVQPLRPIVRLATPDDIRVSNINAKREEEAFGICQRKIAEHKLEMKLVGVECSFDGSKTTFFFTSESRVDFRELVKDLASIFRNRIELRQIGVRDEAKMIGGLGICGRPFCCSRFLDDFQPVSTKMAKTQSMSLNPSKISGTCGRLMCCLRYEQEAYEELVKIVPKLGAFVETPVGYGTVTQVNLLRKLVKVKLDSDDDDSLRTFRAEETATVPGGRPKDGEQPPSVLRYIPVPEPEEPDEPDEIIWSSQDEPEPRENKPEAGQPSKSASKRRRNKKQVTAEQIKPVREETPAPEKHPVKPEPKQKKNASAKPKQQNGGNKPKQDGAKPRPKQEAKPKAEQQKPKPEAKPKAIRQEAAPSSEGNDVAPAKKKNNPNKRRYYHHGKPKPKGDKPK